MFHAAKVILAACAWQLGKGPAMLQFDDRFRAGERQAGLIAIVFITWFFLRLMPTLESDFFTDGA
jgi:hypothetical protein